MLDATSISTSEGDAAGLGATVGDDLVGWEGGGAEDFLTEGFNSEEPAATLGAEARVTAGTGDCSAGTDGAGADRAGTDGDGLEPTAVLDADC